jgi:CDP-diacylglycerol---serine O-phosphatidyltransferase
VIAVIGALIVLYSEYMLIILAMAYLVSGVLARLAYSWSRERRQHSIGVS